jgi:hypothetical protein
MPVSREQLLQLAEPFAPDDYEWRVQTAGEKDNKPWAKVLAYVTNRAIMQRLDDVVGPENWRNEYKASPGAKESGVLCGLSIRVASESNPDGEWVTKWDGADETDIEPTKGGLSGSMKRAAVQWGIGRVLYQLEEGWAVVHPGGRFSAKTKNGQWFKWDPPALPEWAVQKPRHVTADQLTRINALLGMVRSEKVASAMRKRIAGGLTEAAAGDAIRFLETRVADQREENGQASTSAPAPVASAPVAPASTSAAPASQSPAVGGAAVSQTEGAKCPKCAGAMWDNRETKTNPKAPDFKCRDKNCDGVIWPAKAGRDDNGKNLAPAPDPASFAFPKNAPNQLSHLRGKALGACATEELTLALDFLRIKADPKGEAWIDRISAVLEDRRQRGDAGPSARPPRHGSHNSVGDLPGDPAESVMAGATVSNEDLF